MPNPHVPLLRVSLPQQYSDADLMRDVNDIVLSSPPASLVDQLQEQPEEEEEAEEEVPPTCCICQDNSLEYIATFQTFPCCGGPERAGNGAHFDCLEGMRASGRTIKCPLCNNKPIFREWFDHLFPPAPPAPPVAGHRRSREEVEAEDNNLAVILDNFGQARPPSPLQRNEHGVAFVEQQQEDDDEGSVRNPPRRRQRIAISESEAEEAAEEAEEEEASTESSAGEEEEEPGDEGRGRGVFGNPEADATIQRLAERVQRTEARAESRVRRHAAATLQQHADDVMQGLRELRQELSSVSRPEEAARAAAELRQLRAENTHFNGSLTNFEAEAKAFIDLPVGARANPYRPPAERVREEGVLRSQIEMNNLESKRVATGRQMLIQIAKYREITTKLAQKRYEHLSRQVVANSSGSAQRTRDLVALMRRVGGSSSISTDQ